MAPRPLLPSWCKTSATGCPAGTDIVGMTLSRLGETPRNAEGPWHGGPRRCGAVVLYAADGTALRAGDAAVTTSALRGRPKAATPTTAATKQVLAAPATMARRLLRWRSP